MLGGRKLYFFVPLPRPTPTPSSATVMLLETDEVTAFGNLHTRVSLLALLFSESCDPKLRLQLGLSTGPASGFWEDS